MRRTVIIDRTRRLTIIAILLLGLTAPALAMGPVATPFDGLPGGPRVVAPPAMEKAFGDPTDYYASLIAGADYLVRMQADVTEDNAGNGFAPDADPDDGGWDWSATAFQHSAGASPPNCYGVSALGILGAYSLDPQPARFIALKDAADHIVVVGPTVIRSGSDVVFLLRFASLPSCPDPAYYRAGAQAIWNRHITYYGSMQALAEAIRNARQGYPGLIPWDISLWVKAAMLMHAAFPAGGHDVEAAAIAEVIYQDSFAGNPGYFDPDGANQGSDPTWSTPAYWYYTLGVAGIIDAFAASGTHTAELPAMQTLLLECQYADGAFSYQYGATDLVDDRDWQSTAYAMMALYESLPASATTMAALRSAATWSVSTQDITGAWVYGDGSHYPEVGAENASALADAWLAMGASLDLSLGDAGPINCSDTETVTFSYARGDATPGLRGYDMTIRCSAQLTFGVGDVVDLLPFSGVPGLGTPYFMAVDNGDGTVTISGSVLGTTTGLLTDKDLFSITFHPASSGAATMEIVSYRLRDPNNVPIFADVDDASVTVDCVAPEPVSGITVAPGHEKLLVDWTDSTSGDIVAHEVWLGLWTTGVVGVSAYPEYDDVAAYNPASRPASRSAAQSSGGIWVLGATHTVGVDARPFTVPWVPRGIYTVEVFALDSAGNYSGPAPDGNDRATNYWLGDVSDNTPGLYDGLVDNADISMLGSHYGTSPAEGTIGAIADVGPTDDAGRFGLPTTDSRVDFEDLMIFAMNYGVVGPSKSAPVVSGEPVLSWARVDARTWSLSLDAACPALQGLSVSARLPHGVVARVAPGAALAAMGRPLFVRNVDSHGLDAGLAVLGTDSGIECTGELLRVTLPEGVVPTDVVIKARSVGNEDLRASVAPPAETPTPLAFSLSPNVPNPFNPKTRIAFALPVTASVRLAIYALDGSLVRTLARGELAAGNHEVEWDGRDDAGRAMASGSYLCRIEAGAFRQTRKMSLMK